MKKLLISTICFLSIAGQISPPLSACGYSDDYAHFSMFAPEIIGEEDADYFRTLYSSIKVGESDHKDLFKINNTDLWFEFFQKTIPKEDLDAILYKYKLEQIDELIFDLKGKKRTKLKNKILKYSNPSQAKSYLYYIGFAKRCEGVNRRLYYWGDNENDVLKPYEVEKLIKAGLSNYNTNPFPFIKQRYAMQLTRLHFALGLDNKKKSEITGLNAYEFYTKSKHLFTPNTTTELRAKAYAAGHLARTYQIPRANLLYAQLHQNHWMKSTGQMGYTVQDPKEFQATLKLAQNQQDRINLWKLQGLELDGLSAMKAIYKLNPAAPELNILMVRAVNMQEEELDYFLKYSNRLSSSVMKEEYHYPRGNYDSLQHAQIFQFIKKVADNRNTHSPYIWDLATGYLSALQGNKNSAKEYLALAEKKAPKKTLGQEQIRLLGLINNLENFKQLDQPLISNTLSDLKWLFTNEHHAYLRTDFAKIYTRKKLSYIHYNAKRPLLAHCTTPFYEKGFYSKVNNLNQMEAFLNKENKTDWEKLMLQLYEMNIDHMHYMKGLIYTYRGSFDDAITEFEKAKNLTGYFNVNIFNTHINDCHDCDHAKYKGKGFTSLELVKRQKALMTQIIMGNDLSTNYFKLANSYYNISYYGNNRDFYFETMLVSNAPTYYRHYSSENYNSSPLYFLYDNQLSLKYYMLASQNSNNPEFKAKCHYMAAKCERNAWYDANQNKFADEYGGGVYFGVLKKEI